MQLMLDKQAENYKDSH